jgi:outer membrane protein
MRILASFTLFGLVCCGASAQDLTLERALEMAGENNGTVRAAHYNYLASRAAARSAHAAFLPTLTPAFQYDVTRTNTYTGAGAGLFNDNSSTSSVTADWRLLDNGTRDALYRRSALNRDSAELSALQTLRQTLFGVHRAFYDALRAEEILRIRQAQLERAIEIEKQAKEFAITGAGAQKDILQATADMLNARASELGARNAVSTSRASLKAAIGVPRTEEIEALVGPSEVAIEGVDYSLEDALREGLTNRPDLAAQRLQVQAQGQSVRLARLDRGLNWSVDAQHTRAFSPDGFDHSALVFMVTVPLYDGDRTAENLRASRLSLEAERALLTQSERDAVAEIESAFKEFAQNRERLEASRAALEAAKLNYKAAFDSRAEGAGELIEVLTAQVSLTTAESNYTEAFYDTLISRVQLMLVTGRPIPGERQ